VCGSGELPCMQEGM